MIGVMRCGTPSYAESSTRFGSTRMSRTSSGVDRMRIDVMRLLMQLDLPAPVAPATSRWGMRARLAMTKPPSTSLPIAAASG